LERIFPFFLTQVLGKNGDEGDGQRAFCKETPEQIGDTEGDEKGVCDEPRPKKSGHNDVANKAKDATQQSEESHRAGRLTDLLSLGYGDI
jgi:hypothetical protein